MTEKEFETLLVLLRKFNLVSGESILAIEAKIFEYLQKTPTIFETRDGQFMDDKMAYEYDMQKMDENQARYDKQEYERD